MTTENGWWTLNIEMFDGGEPDDATLEHIAAMIIEGMTSGEVIQETGA